MSDLSAASPEDGGVPADRTRQGFQLWVAVEPGRRLQDSAHVTEESKLESPGRTAPGDPRRHGAAELCLLSVGVILSHTVLLGRQADARGQAMRKGGESSLGGWSLVHVPGDPSLELEGVGPWPSWEFAVAGVGVVSGAVFVREMS